LSPIARKSDRRRWRTRRTPPATQRIKKAFLLRKLDLRTVYAKNGIMSPEEEPEGKDKIKPLFWVASSKNDLRDFPDEVKELMGFALYQAQKGGKHLAAKPLKGFGGAGVLEVVEDHGGSTYRTVYTVKFTGAVYVLDAFQKKSKKGIKTPQPAIERIKSRLRAAKEHHQTWQSQREKKDGK
jgi:phage-related protein